MILLLSDPVALIALVLLGVIAGTLGGMLGVGGSVVIIPGLAILFSFDRMPEPNQHLFQAAAMIVNVAVSVPATLRHRKADALVSDALVWMLPAALVFVVIGVWASNLPIFEGADGGRWLGRLLAVFLVYVIWVNLQKLRAQSSVENVDDRLVTPTRGLTVGSVMGSIAGLLGIGGGAIAVPMQQLLLKLPLRNCIGNSSAIICISAAIGAIYKNATLAQHVSGSSPVDWRMSLVIAAMLAPTAWAGARLGASLTHSLPLKQVRLAFIFLMAVAAWKMASLPFGPCSG
jgi:uncharacterized membrane protein YfcA